MKFISQTPVDDEGKYTMTWLTKDGVEVITKHDVFNL
jgi:hypothetical protein